MEGGQPIALPMVARSLCKEAVEVANGFIAELGETYDSTNDQAFLVELFVGLKMHADIVGWENLSMPPFDSFDVFNIPTDEAVIRDHLRNNGFTEESQTYKSIFGAEAPNLTKGQFALMLYWTVQWLKLSEDRMLSVNNVDYGQVMAALDGWVHRIASLVRLATTIDAGAEYIKGKVKRRAGGKIAGQKRTERYGELKGMVLDEVAKHYSQIDSAKAARAVLNKLGPNSKWLLDEKTNKPLSPDFIALFTRWIRDFRSNQANSSKA